ncbi:Uncharacterised protein [Mycobacteroides abscessus subsp. massiliense]|nr:Uncharacterised protein [Mycobacteroides abscessus subsp. massiliense]
MEVQSDDQHRVGYRGSDKAGARFIRGQFEVGHHIHIKIVNRCGRGDDSAHHGQVLQACRHFEPQRSVVWVASGMSGVGLGHISPNASCV